MYSKIAYVGKAFIWDFKQLIICTLLCPSYVCTQLAPGPQVGSFQVFIFPMSSVQNLSIGELAEPRGTRWSEVMARRWQKQQT